MRGFSAWSLLALFSVLLVRGLAQEFDLEDALDDPVTATPKPKPKEPIGGGGAGHDLSLHDLLPTKKPAVKPADPVKTTSKPKPKPNPKPGSELDLADALDPKNDIKGGGSFTDEDLDDVAKDGGYKPDKGKGGKGSSSDSDMHSADDDNHDTMAETGTIAGIVSAVAMALVGAVSSYISYQKKKFCFSIQQSLNADMVKAENPEAVVAQEPQVQQTLLQPPNAEPPAKDNVV